MIKKKVVIGLSGGVDSSISAYLLKQQNFDVTAVFMQNWDPFLNNENNFNQNKNLICDSEIEFDFAKKVAKKLDIPIYKTNFIKQYWTEVFEPFLFQYKKGLTPNPDILCNKYIKFGYFFDYCFKKFNCDYIATGHYAKINFDNKLNLYQLCEAKDNLKDQTYFLCELNQFQLSKTIFPLADITKLEVRKLAQEIGLENWNKKDSMGICFVGKRNFSDFLKNYISDKQGLIIDIKTKKIVGKHNGLHLYTIGQRKGLNLFKTQTSYFVCEKNLEENVLYVISSEYKNDFLYSTSLISYQFNWISQIPKNNKVEIKFRHSTNKTIGEFFILDNKNNNVLVKYKSKAKAVTIGQYVVLYQDKICLGGGQIEIVN